jgi:hypothetical protein
MRGCSDELRRSECERSSEQEHVQNSHIVPSGSTVPSPGPTTLSELAAADVADCATGRNLSCPLGSEFFGCVSFLSRTGGTLEYGETLL